jgi:hypothetical protein
VPTLPNGTVLGQTCYNAENDYALDYPNGWTAELSFRGWKCALFDPQPFTVEPDTEVPPVAVIVSMPSSPLDVVLAQYTDPSMGSLISQSGVIIAGQRGIAVELRASANSPFPAGTSRYAVLVDWNNRTFMIETDSASAGDYAAVKQVVLGMAKTLRRVPQ